MKQYRSILAFLLAGVAAFLVSCGSPAVVKPPTYTSAQIEQIQDYVADIEALRSRLPELAKLIQQENWVFVRNFIHGPLGSLRPTMSYIERNLLPKEQPQARKASKTVFNDLIAIDEAAQKGDYKAAIRGYASVQKDVAAFVDLTPKA